MSDIKRFVFWWQKEVLKMYLIYNLEKYVQMLIILCEKVFIYLFYL